MIWVQKKTGVPVINISSLNEAKEFLKKHHMFVVGRFEKFEVCYFSVYLVYVCFLLENLDKIKNKPQCEHSFKNIEHHVTGP